MGVYSHLKEILEPKKLNETMKESLSFIWIHAIASPHKLCRIVECLTSISDLQLETYLRERFFDRPVKRMRLAKTLGNFNYTAYVNAQQAFQRGMKLKLAGWTELSSQGRHTFIEKLMNSQTDNNLQFVGHLVNEYLFGEEMSCDCMHVSG